MGDLQYVWNGDESVFQIRRLLKHVVSYLSTLTRDICSQPVALAQCVRRGLETGDIYPIHQREIFKQSAYLTLKLLTLLGRELKQG